MEEAVLEVFVSIAGVLYTSHMNVLHLAHLYICERLRLTLELFRKIWAGSQLCSMGQGIDHSHKQGRSLVRV